MADKERYLEIRETGKRTVVAFLESDTWDFHFLARCEDELDDLIEHCAFETLAFDLTGVERISSTLLGIFLSLKRCGFEIELLNPSAEVRDVLETMHLERLIFIEPPNGSSPQGGP
ncbi:MAG: STAS domain-containing protein [Pirellulales bacterium]